MVRNDPFQLLALATASQRTLWRIQKLEPTWPAFKKPPPQPRTTPAESCSAVNPDPLLSVSLEVTMLVYMAGKGLKPTPKHRPRTTSLTPAQCGCHHDPSAIRWLCRQGSVLKLDRFSHKLNATVLVQVSIYPTWPPGPQKSSVGLKHISIKKTGSFPPIAGSWYGRAYPEQKLSEEILEAVGLFASENKPHIHQTCSNKNTASHWSLGDMKYSWCWWHIIFMRWFFMSLFP